jgi:hypothetical protein
MLYPAELWVQWQKRLYCAICTIDYFFAVNCFVEQTGKPRHTVAHQRHTMRHTFARSPVPPETRQIA